MDREFIDWNYIISFMMQRWQVKKKDIALKLFTDASKLSRNEPIQYDPQLAYERLFKLTETQKGERIKSLAFEHEKDEWLLLEALRVFLLQSNCIFDANLIYTSVKKEQNYQTIMLELFKRANTLPPKAKDSVKKECAKSTPSPSEQEPPTTATDGDTTLVDDKVERTFPNSEVVVALDDTALPDTNRTKSKIESGGAHLSVPDEYRRCLFCTRWKGNTSIAYESISGVFGDCIMYKREQISTGGTDCKNYEPDYDRIGFKEAVKPMSFLLE